MSKSDVIFIITLTAFFVIHLFFTQKIYTYNNFASFLVFSLLFPVLILLYSLDESKDVLLQIGSFESMFLVNFLVLILIKKNYKKMNRFLIHKNLINKEYADKDFTFVHSGGDIDKYWDEKLSKKPSRLDSILTLLLLIIPLLFIVLANMVIQSL